MSNSNNEDVVVNVIYDFEYQTSDSRWIWMKEGEKLTVVKQTNDDWWKVIRANENVPFYAPVTYLEIVPQDDDLINSNVTTKEDSDFDNSLKNNSDTGYSNSSNDLVNSTSTDAEIVCNSVESNNDNVNLNVLQTSQESGDEDAFNSSRAVEGYHNPGYAKIIPKTIITSSDQEHSKESHSSSEKLNQDENQSNINESSSPVYANLRMLSMCKGETPMPSPKQVPIKILLNHWAVYEDKEGRTYYYNSVTRQSSWKPPRKRLDKPHSNSTSSIEERLEGYGATSVESLPSIVRPASIFYDSLPQDKSFSSSSSQNKLNILDKPKTKSDSNLNKELSVSSDKISSERKMRVHLSSPSILRKFKKSFRVSPRSVRKKNINNNEIDKNCDCIVERNSSRNDVKRKSDATLFFNPLYSSSEKVDKTTNSFSLPKGWTKVIDKKSGRDCFINLSTGAKWFTSVNNSGKSYFYQENGTESFWELPPVYQQSSHDSSKEDLSAASKVHKLKTATIHNRFMSLERDAKSRSLIFNSVSESDVKNISSNDIVPVLSEKSVTLPRSLASSTCLKDPWLNLDTQDVIREGQLSKTKLMEGGKRKRKDWSTSHVVLTNSHLIFYKDFSKSPTTKQPPLPSKPELCIDLAGAQIDWSPEKSSRKNVFQINTSTGLLLLLQDNNSLFISEWFTVIRNVVETLPLPFSIDVRMKCNTNDADPQTENPKMPRSKSLKFTRPSTFEMPDYIPNSAEKKKIKKKLKLFFLKRPTMESLAEKGILQDEPVFGCDIIKICERQGTTIPRFVQECIGAIEQRDMKADGLYRVSGNLSQVQRIRCQVNQDIFTGVHMEEDVHVLSGALKMFFRHMKEPLIPINVYEKLMAAIRVQTRIKRLSLFRESIHHLPKPNFDTLRFLLQHLIRVTEYSSQNRMHVQNLAIVFGPNLMGFDTKSVDLAVDMMHQNQITEFLLLEFEGIYGSNS